METTFGEIDLALGRAVLYSALALGFRPPDDEMRARLCSAEGSAVLAGAAERLDQSGNLAAAARALAAVDSGRDRLVESYHRLFGHTARGAVSPYETEYGSEALFQQPQEMGDLMGFYRAFGLALNAAEHERPDHISCECEFASFLALKEAHALESGDAPMLEETRKAARLFLRDHLGRFAPAFAAKLRQQDAAFYGALADLCERLVTADCSRAGVPHGPRSLSLRPVGDDGIPMACGATECPAMPAAGPPEG
ncbi:MAG TPA: molecular chaperone TorD family protein [candidate division Zixibacteria bacterium]|nr:molecular chaperone TorD family protein [candidate division Zixibacteria bacterium]